MLTINDKHNIILLVKIYERMNFQMKSPNTKALKELIGNNLRKARIEKGLTQCKLSEISGVERSLITKMELGQHFVSLETFLKLAVALGCSIEYLLKGYEKFITLNINISQQDIDRANKEIARKLEDVDKRLFQSMIYAKTERFR